MPRATFSIAAQEPEMDRERVLDLLGATYDGQYIAGAAEWLKNSLDHALRTREPGDPVILFHISTPRGSPASRWTMECVDFLGTTYEEIEEHLRVWGSEVAASRGNVNWKGFGGHGNGGKFHMRQNFGRSEFITYRNGRLTVFGFDADRRYGFDPHYQGIGMDPDEALRIAGLDPEAMPISEEIRQRLRSGDVRYCRFTVVRGIGFRHARRWRMRENFDDKLRAHPQAKQVLDRAHVIYWSDTETIDPIEPPKIERREGYEGGRSYDMPSELAYDDEKFTLTSEPLAGRLTLEVAAEPFHRNDPSHVVDVKGRHGLVIASERVTELPIRNRAGADFIFGILDAPALDELGLRENTRIRLLRNDFSEAVLEWVARQIDDLSDELAEDENARRRERDTQATLLLTNRLNRWKNRFLRARETFISVGPGEGTGEGGTGGGGSGGPGLIGTDDTSGGGGEATGGQGEGGSGGEAGGGGSGDQQRRGARFPDIRVSGFDPDPQTGEIFQLHPRHNVVYQRPHDFAQNLWWINAQRPLAERILNEELDGADSSRWRDYVFNRFVEVIQAYDIRERYDPNSDITDYLWDLLGQVHDSAARELSDVLFASFGHEETPSEVEVSDVHEQVSGSSEDTDES